MEKPAPTPKKRFFTLLRTRRKSDLEKDFEYIRVKADVFPPFYIFRLPSEMLESEKALKVFYAYRNKLIFPLSAELPQELASLAFSQERYSRECMRVFAEKMLDSIPVKARVKNTLIRDRDLISANAALSAVPKIEKIYADTENEEAFLSFCEKAMDAYGAVIMRANEISDLRRFDLIVDIDGGVIYYTPENKYGGGTVTLRPDSPVIPQTLEDILPAGADYYSIVAAMYEIYGFMLDND